CQLQGDADREDAPRSAGGRRRRHLRQVAARKGGEPLRGQRCALLAAPARPRHGQLREGVPAGPGAHRTGRRPARHGPPRRPVGGGDRARETVTDRSGGMPLTRPLFAAALLASATALAEGPQTLTIDDAVNEAMQVNDQLRAVRFRAEGAEDTARSARGRLLPALSASDTWQHWDGP